MLILTLDMLDDSDYKAEEEIIRQMSLLYFENNPNKDSLKRLENLKNTYSEIDIEGVIKEILSNWVLEKSGNLKIPHIFKNNIYLDEAYKLITFGNLSTKGTSIILDALVFAVNYLNQWRLSGNGN